MSYKVKIETFEGPFDLLVYLIEDAQMNIYDIAISSITAQYLSYLEEMKKLDVAIGSEFLVLAAQLIEIKSKMLIPRMADSQEGEIMEDPRSELVERLLEYKMFKEASQMLSDRADETARIYEKPQEDLSEFIDSREEVLDLEIGDFVKVFNAFIEKKQRVEAVKKKYVRVKRERESTETRIAFIKNIFRLKNKRTISFKDTILDRNDKYDVVLSFTSLLEMVKGRSVKAAQESMYGDISITNLEEDYDEQKDNEISL